jgi:putative ABC transport system permease protein
MFSSSTLPALLSNFRIALAWAHKQPLYFAVKVFGLALGIMSVSLLSAYVGFVQDYDTHIPQLDQVYRVVPEYTSRENGDRVRYDFGSNAWIDAFKNEYADQYASAGVLVRRNGVFAHETTVFDERYLLAEPGIIPLFGLDLVQGDVADALGGPNKVILSEAAALRYFGTNTNVVGRTLTLDGVHDAGVSGVFRNLPRHTNFPMEVVVSLDTAERVLPDATLRNTLWIMITNHTLYVRFDDPEKARLVSADLNDFVYRRSPEQDLGILERNKFTLVLQPLTDVFMDPRTGNTNGDDFTNRNTYYGIWILAALVILGACVNYISLTVGQVQLRIKELAVRTSFGATRGTLVMQLVAESLIVSAPAALLSAQLLYVLVPPFSAVVDVPMEIADVVNFVVWGTAALAIVVLCALVSAGPVLFCREETVKERTHKLQVTRFGLRAGSVVIFFQFALSTLAAILVLGIYLQIQLLRNVDAGLDAHNLVFLDTRFNPASSSTESFAAVRDELLQLPDVEALSLHNASPPSTGSFTNWARLGGEPIEHTVSHLRVNPDFLATYGIELLAGRNFSLDRPSELIVNGSESPQNLGILLTRNAVRRFGFASSDAALGQPFRYTMDADARTYTVIGVVDDFVFSPMEVDVRSVAVLQGSAEPQRTITLRLREGYSTATLDSIRAIWSRHVPGVPFNLTYLEDVVDAEVAGRTESLALAASMATIVFFCTAIIGIYAQAAFVCDRNAKSIAIRKVLGSSAPAILALLLGRFAVPVLASFALALPVSIYFLRVFYASFQQTPGFPVELYLLCLASIIIVALVTVFTHCRRAAARHPIHTLRYE